MALTFDKTEYSACLDAAEGPDQEAAQAAAMLDHPETLKRVRDAIANCEISFSSDDNGGYRLVYGPRNTTSAGDSSFVSRSSADDPDSWIVSTYPQENSGTINVDPNGWAIGGGWAGSGWATQVEPPLNMSEIREKLARLEQLEKEMETLKKVFSWLFPDEEDGQKP